VRICFVPNDMEAPGFYRCLAPGRQLKALGHTVFLPPYTTKEREDGATIFTFEIERVFQEQLDICVLHQRKERMWPEGGIHGLRFSGVITVADVDDNYRELPKWNPAWLGTHPYKRGNGIVPHAERQRFKRDRTFRHKVLAQAGISSAEARRAYKNQYGREFPKNRHNRDHMHEGFRLVDALTVSTPYLAELYSDLNPNVHVIRNYVDWDMWADVTPAYERERDHVRIGWYGAFDYRTGDLDILRPWLSDWLRRNPAVQFVTTDDRTHDYLKIPADQRVTTGRVEFRDYDLSPLMDFDIGLVPLKLNGLNEAKSHLKGMEMNAAGIPFIASPTESYANYWCDEGANGFIARDSGGWADALHRLVRDESLRRSVGRTGRWLAEQNSYQRNAWRWESFYRGLAGDDVDGLAREAIRRHAIQKRTEIAALAHEVANRKPQVVVEIGTAQGGTFWLWCQLAAPDAILVSIDLPGGDFGGKVGDTYGERDYEKIRSYGREGQTVHLIRANSQIEETRAELARLLDGRSIDFLMIDGDHAYEGVKRDFELYSPLVDGIVAFHDIAEHPRLPSEVDQLWAEIKDAYPHREYVDAQDPSQITFGGWGGIGVLEVTKERMALAA
jgi:predicted O-methyltransferase YrrM